LVVTAIATSLPELFVTVISNRDHEEKLALGNIIGSNIYNLALIGGLIALLPDFNLHVLPSSTWWILFAATLALLLIIRIYSGRVVPKWIGVVMVFGFLGYLLLLNPQ
jgi:cation:H+ antiporter